MNMTSHVFS